MMKKLITFLVAILTFSSIVDPFIASTVFDQAMPLFVFIVLAIGSEIFISKTIVVLLVESSALLYLSYQYSLVQDSNILIWVIDFFNRSVTNVWQFFTQPGVLLFYDVSVFLVGLVLLGLVRLSIKKNRWFIPFAGILGYFLILVAFNKSIIITPLIQLLIGTVLWKLWSMYGMGLFKRWKHVLVISLGVLVVLQGSLNYTSIYNNLYHNMVSETFPLRVALSEKGFYRLFTLNRITGIGAYSGYSDDDSALGGPLYLNYDTVFEVKQEKSTYWKMANRYVYTGKGWENTSYRSGSSLKNLDVLEETTPYVETAKTSQFTAIPGTLHALPIPYGKVQVQYRNPSTQAVMTYYPKLEQKAGFGLIQLPDNAQEAVLDLEYTYYDKDVSAEDLRGVGVNDAYFKELTELPRSVTERTRNLAQTITKDASTVYDKVMAIKTYLAGPEFTYELEDVPYVPETMDFVDHFLFESKRGYCEHFSTAMTVLLRAVDIPTRWAKGYSSGTLYDYAESTYRIANADAHAWVEVYFDTYGWIPFEATKGFSQSFLQADNSGTINPTNPNTNTPSPTNPQTPNPTPNPTNPQAPTQPNNQNTPKDQGSNVILDTLAQYTTTIIIVLAAVWILRRFIYSFFVAITLRMGVFTLKKSYGQMLKVLNWAYPRKMGVGLEMYGALLPEGLKDDYNELTEQVQAIVYGDSEDVKLDETNRRRLLNLVKAVTFKQHLIPETR